MKTLYPEIPRIIQQVSKHESAVSREPEDDSISKQTRKCCTQGPEEYSTGKQLSL